jgi:hypothetical protein
LCHLWWRNPIFYLGLLFAVETTLTHTHTHTHILSFLNSPLHFLTFLISLFQVYSTVSLFLHLSWLFVWGIVISTISIIVFGAGVIYYSTFSVSLLSVLHSIFDRVF